MAPYVWRHMYGYGAVYMAPYIYGGIYTPPYVWRYLSGTIDMATYIYMAPHIYDALYIAPYIYGAIYTAIYIGRHLYGATYMAPYIQGAIYIWRHMLWRHIYFTVESLNKESGSLLLSLAHSLQIQELVVPGLSLEAFLIVTVDI